MEGFPCNPPHLQHIYLKLLVKLIVYHLVVNKKKFLGPLHTRWGWGSAQNLARFVIYLHAISNMLYKGQNGKTTVHNNKQPVQSGTQLHFHTNHF